MAIKFTLSCVILCAVASITSAAASSDDVNIILDTHNELRGSVNPTATDMNKLYWNVDLARTAQQWVDECSLGHDDSYQRRQDTDIGASVGQNFATGTDDKDWDEVVRKWHSEEANFAYGFGSTDGEDIGHYTQVVWGATPLVGCGYKNCSGTPHYVCNYAWGNLGMETPYQTGDTSCALCPSTCTDNLCDCNGKMCKNGGTMDLNACTCTCANGFTGDECETCPFVDQTESYTLDMCPTYTSVPETRPILCGFCPDVCEGRTISYCQYEGTLQSDCTCKCLDGYTGESCSEITNCADQSYCGIPQPYGFTDDLCTISDVQVACPIMCELC